MYRLKLNEPLPLFLDGMLVSPSSLTIPVSTNITTEQVMKEAVARFRLQEDPDPNIDTYQLVKVTLEAGRGKLFNALGIFYEAFNITNLFAFLFDTKPLCYFNCFW